MADTGAMGRTEAARRLRLRGFAPSEAEALAALKVRHDAGEFHEPTDAIRRAYGRYLVEAGWFDEWGATRQVPDHRPLEELLRDADELIRCSWRLRTARGETPAA
jgi:hypothetical protein